MRFFAVVPVYQNTIKNQAGKLAGIFTDINDLKPGELHENFIHYPYLHPQCWMNGKIYNRVQ